MKLRIDQRVAEKFPRAKIAELIGYARPPGVARFEIEFAPQRYTERAPIESPHQKYYCHRASAWSGCAFITERRILIRVPVIACGPYAKPYQFGGAPNSSGYQGHRVFSAEEAMLYILAHELRHLWQRKVPRGWRVWGARGRYSERDCDCYALGVVRRWRRRCE